MTQPSSSDEIHERFLHVLENSPVAYQVWSFGQSHGMSETDMLKSMIIALDWERMRLMDQLMHRLQHGNPPLFLVTGDHP